MSNNEIIENLKEIENNIIHNDIEIEPENDNIVNEENDCFNLLKETLMVEPMSKLKDLLLEEKKIILMEKEIEKETQNELERMKYYEQETTGNCCVDLKLEKIEPIMNGFFLYHFVKKMYSFKFSNLFVYFKIKPKDMVEIMEVKTIGNEKINSRIVVDKILKSHDSYLL